MDEIRTALRARDMATLANSLTRAERYAEKHPDFPPAKKLDLLSYRARQYTHEGKYPQAIAVLRAVLTQMEGNELGSKTDFYPGNAWMTLGILYRYIQNTDSAMFCYEKSLEVTQLESEKTRLLMIPNIETNIGTLLLEKGEINEAIEHYAAALEVRYQQEEIDSVNLANSLENLGIAYGRKGDYEKNLFFLEEALKIRVAIFPANSYRLASPYTNLAVAYSNFGQHEKANRYYEKAYAISDNIENTNQKDLYIRLRINQSRYFERKKEYSQSEKLLREAIDYSKLNLGEKHSYTAISLTRLGNILLTQEKYHPADSCFLKAQEVFDQIPDGSYIHRAEILQSRGYLKYQQKEYQASIQFYQEADSLYEIATGQFSHHRGHVSIMKGKVWQKSGDCIRANENFQNAINIFFKNELKNVSQLAETPSLDPVKTLSALISYSDHLQSCYPGQKDSLEKARVILSEYQVMLSRFRHEIQEEEDLASLSERSHELHHLVLDNLFLQHPSESIPNEGIENAFRTIEKNTRIFLHQSVSHQSNAIFSTLPGPLLESERTVMIELAYLEKSLSNELEKEIPDSTFISRIRDQLFVFQNRSDSIRNIIRTTYPDYYQLKYDPSVAEPVQLQRSLPPNTTLLHYVLGNTQNYLFIINSTEVHLIKLPGFDSGLIEDLRKAITGPYLKSMDHRQSPEYYDSLYRQTAYKLYQHLIAPVENNPDIQLSDRLVIIPSAELNYLPFSSLLTSPVNEAGLPGTYPYLLRRYAISYAFSATSYYRQMKGSSSPKEKGLLAFAPDFRETSFDDSKLISTRLRGHLSPLDYNQQEVENISRGLAARLFTGREASRSQFVNLASDYQFLHIASHAMLDDTDHRFSYIAFSPDSSGGAPSLLFLADLYGLEIQAEMVVLSACNTASGKLLNGEGVASLSQGFAYAGARSLVTTLWSVNDAATAQLMTYFYEGLEENLPKDIALQKARLRLLEEENSPPFFWGAPIAVGDMSPIEKTDWYKAVFVSLLGILIGLIIFFRRKARREI